MGRWLQRATATESAEGCDWGCPRVGHRRVNVEDTVSTRDRGRRTIETEICGGRGWGKRLWECKW